MKTSIFLFLLPFISADTPADCRINQIYGKWSINLSKTHKTLNCTFDENETHQKIIIELSAPNIATFISPENGETGTFTMIYNQGFEIVIGLRTYCAFFEWWGPLPYYTDVKYSCDKTMPGWSHDFLGNDYRCFKAFKLDSDKIHFNSNDQQINLFRAKDEKMVHNMANVILNERFQIDEELVQNINNLKTSWTASTHEHLWNEKMTIKQAKLMGGAFKSQFKIKKARNSEQTTRKESKSDNQIFFTSSNAQKTEIPDEFDWRNVEGQNFVSPVRHQDQCGSCYIFSSAGQLESRIRIATNNVKQPVLSPQQVIDCSPYGQGCEGGFPYLIAGKWAADFGFVDESCYPYEGKDATCRDPILNQFMDEKVNIQNKACFNNRYRTAMYGYVGGYFGNSNAQNMKEELYRHGPISIGFEVLDDFRYYKGGIYQHTGLKTKINKVSENFEVTNHAVLLVGYGHCEKKNLDYWIVKNSWGDKWGEDGYFRIVRGVDEVGVESMGQRSFVIPPL